MYLFVDLIIIGAGNGVSSFRHQAITLANADILPIGKMLIKYESI